MTSSAASPAPRAAVALNAVGFYAGWTACAWGPLWGRPWIGPAVVALAVAGQWAAWRRPGEGSTIALATALGTCMDLALIRLGVFRVDPELVSPALLPLWLAAFHANFAATVRGCLAWLAGRPRLGAALGAAGGPLAYGSGAWIGVIEPFVTPIGSLAALAVGWAAYVPALFALSGALGRRGAADPTDNDPSHGGLRS